MNKKLFMSIFIFALLLSFVFTPTYLSAEANSDMTLKEASKVLEANDEELYNSMSDEEKNEKEISIAEKYDEGDILSEEDTIFLLNQAKTVNDNLGIQPYAGSSSKYVSNTRTRYGTKVRLSGRMYQNISSIAGTSTYRGNLTLTRLSGSLKKVSLATHHSAYGVIGWNGKYPTIGRVYKGSVGMSKTKYLNSTRMDKTKKYTSVLPSYTTMYSQATVTTSKGDVYTVTSPSWSRTQ